MKTIILSSDTCARIGPFRENYPRYERVQRKTPSGRIYESLTMTNPDGSGTLRVSEIAPDGSRALRGIAHCTFLSRSFTHPTS